MKKHLYKALYYQNQQNPYIKLNKTSINHILTSYFQISIKNTKSKKSRAGNMKYFENKRKPIPFLEDW